MRGSPTAARILLVAVATAALLFVVADTAAADIRKIECDNTFGIDRDRGIDSPCVIHLGPRETPD